jgi:hypothetical protein
MAKRKKIEQIFQKLEAGKAEKSSSVDSPSYIYHSPDEYQITIPSLDAWGYGERAVIRFQQDNTPVGSIVFHMHLPFNMFDSVVDILRYEKPVKFDFNVLEEMAFFSTEWEPVGEGE